MKIEHLNCILNETLGAKRDFPMDLSRITCQKQEIKLGMREYEKVMLVL